MLFPIIAQLNFTGSDKCQEGSCLCPEKNDFSLFQSGILDTLNSLKSQFGRPVMENPN